MKTQLQKSTRQTKKNEISIKLHLELEIRIMKIKYSLCMNELNKLRDDKINTMCNYIKSLKSNKTILDNIKPIIKNLTEIGDFSALYRESININNSYGYNMESMFESMQNGLNAFYSISLTEQEKHKQNALAYFSKYKFENDDPPKYYFQNLYSSIIDNNRRQDIHSGFSFGYCNIHVVGLIMKPKNEKLELWCKLINSYVIKYNL